MARNVLGISWLNGRFHAVALRGSVVTGSWTSPSPVLNEIDFAPALQAAVRETCFTGSRVNVALDHRSVLFHVQDTPPVKGKTLTDLLERLVRQNRFFEEQAAWTHLTLPPAKGHTRQLLALLPTSFVRRISEACAAEQLQLECLLPLAAMLSSHLRQLPIAPDEVVVLGADLDGSLHLVLGRGDGQLLFSRSVVLAGAQQSERASQEINRTLQYAQQQFGAIVNHLFVFGDQASSQLKDLQIRQGLKLQQSPVAADPLCHARQAASASARTSLNLVPRTAQRQRRLRKLATAGLAALLIAAVAVTLKVEIFARARESRHQSRARQLEADAGAIAATHARQREASHLAAFLRLVGTTNEPPVPELFARHLAAIVPEAMRLTQFGVRRETNGWQFQIEGFARQETGGYLALAAQLDQNLKTGAFHAHITDSTHQRVSGITGGEQCVHTHPPGGARDEKPFFARGFFR